MLSLLFVAVLLCLVSLLVLSTIFRRLKTSLPGFDEPARIPDNTGWSLLLAAAALNIFAYKVGFGIGYGLFGACTIAGILFLFPAQKRTKEVWFLAVVGIAACLLFGFRANEFVQGMNVLTALICAGTLVLLRSVEHIRWNGLWFLKMKIGFLMRFLNHPSSLGSTLRNNRTTNGTMVLTGLKTIALTLVILLFFSWILSAADPVFEKLIRVVREQALGRTLFSGILITLLFACFTVTVPSTWQEKAPQFKVLSFMETFIPALSLALLFGLFLGVQIKYLFGTHADFPSLGITYSDYVRRGFVELLIATFFGSLLSYALILKQKALTEAGKILKLQWVNGILLVELLLLLASAAKRDWMYVEIYGLTRVRIIGAIFLFWLLGIIALILALNVLRRMTERHVLSAAVILCSVVVLTLNAVNIDAVVALSSPPRGERPDIVYMSRLSSDAVEGWLAALNESYALYESLRTKTTFSEKEKALLANTKIALALLDDQIGYLSDAHPWREWNWSRGNAFRRMQEIGLQSSLTLIQCVSRGIRDMQILTKTDLYEQEARRINDYSSPFIFRRNTYYPESLDSLDTSLSPRSSASRTPPTCADHAI